MLMGKLPQNPKKGQIAVLKRKGRKITFKATGKTGFGKWRIVSNEKA
jgi:hypothetical protein